MAINPYNEVDYLAVARERVTEQFKNKEVFDRYLQLLVSGQTELQQVYKDLMQLRSLDTAVGAQLDNLGEIVGQKRELVELILQTFFGFSGNLQSGAFGEYDNPASGAPWYDLGTPLTGTLELSDEQYRLFIKARIAKNTTNATPEQFIQAVKFILNPSYVFLQEIGNANINVQIGRILSLFEKQIIKGTDKRPGLLPKPIGVGLYYSEFDPTSYFGFLDTPGALGFGELITTHTYNGSFYYDGSMYYDSAYVLEEGIGGKFAEIF